jgi:hypothetical protein
MFGYSYELANDTTGLFKPLPPVSPAAPDISNWVGNDTMGRQANFGMEMLKFMPRFEMMAYAGKKKAPEGEGQTINYFDNDGVAQTWQVTDDWYNAFNEYGISSALYDKWTIDPDHNPLVGTNPTNNSGVVSWLTGHTTSEGYNYHALDYHTTWVFGFNHFNIGIKPDQYWWGEGTGGNFTNVDFIAESGEWNHIGVKKHADQKDARWEAGVGQNNLFGVNDFLQSIGTSWESANAMLNSDQFQGLNYYEMVMNMTNGRPSYKNLNQMGQLQFIATMIESRNRAWQAMSEVFGPVAKTWDDQQMMSHFQTWLNQNRSPVFSHGLDLFRFFFGIQHSFINRVTQFYKDGDMGKHEGYNQSALDSYAFAEFGKDMGGEWYNNADFNGDGSKTRGAIFDYVASQFGWGDDIQNFMKSDIPGFSPTTKPGEIGLPGAFSDYSEAQKAKLRGCKWLAEQWFGAAKSTAAYNNMPKWEGHMPAFDLGNSDHYDVFNIAGVGEVRVSKAVTDPNEARSYSWDRVAGPYHKDGSGYIVTTGGDHWSSPEETNLIHDALRGMGYQIGYVTPYTDYYNHYNYARVQFAGLTYRDIMGSGGKMEPYQNSWAVRSEGLLYRSGHQTDMMRLWNWLSNKAMMQKAHEEDKDKYDEAKERIEWEKTISDKAEGKRSAERSQLDRDAANKQQQRQQAQQNELQKSTEKAAARSRQLAKAGQKNKPKPEQK